MIKLTNEPTSPGVLPSLMGVDAVGPKGVLVIKGGQSQLKAGDWVVLTTAGGKAYELKSRSDHPSAADRDGTYVHSSVSEEMGEDFDNPTLRLYNRADVVKKLGSSAGVFLTLSTVLAIAIAAFGAWFVLAGDSGPSASATAAKARTLLAWATEPQLGLNDNATPAAIAAVRNKLERRQRRANDCLEGLRGGEGAPPAVAGIACTTSSPAFWRDKDNAGLVAGVLGLVAVVLAAIGSAKHFAPGSNPSD